MLLAAVGGGGEGGDCHLFEVEFGEFVGGAFVVDASEDVGVALVDFHLMGIDVG